MYVYITVLCTVQYNLLTLVYNPEFFKRNIRYAYVNDVYTVIVEFLNWTEPKGTCRPHGNLAK
jgi:hypothetical protein